MDGVRPLISTAATMTLGPLLTRQAEIHPERVALVQDDRQWTYRAFDARVNQVAAMLQADGVVRGERVAICAENRHEYLEVVMAAAKLGVIAATINWRLHPNELRHCIALVSARRMFCSPRFLAGVQAACPPELPVTVFGDDYEAALARHPTHVVQADVDPEDGLLIVYTSGTTGYPKGALISHRAELARLHVNALEFGLRPGDTFVAWPPMFHMIATEQCTHVLCTGGTVVIVDGFDLDRLVEEIATRTQWWLILMPGMTEPLLERIKALGVKPAGIRLIGVMADLLPRHHIAELTQVLGAPFANTFGCTETGLPPGSAGRIAIGEVPVSLAKEINQLCCIRLVDDAGDDVPDGAPGELVFRGPTLFSGYWNAPEVNAKEFRDGWYRMGDMFVRNPDGTLTFADRAKYLIKSGGENIYPAEIERVIMASPKVRDVVVVRRQDTRWGEVPIAVVVRKDDSLDAHEITALCRIELAAYKRPKGVIFVDEARIPRSVTGKIQRHEIEKWSDVLACEIADIQRAGDPSPS